MLEFTCAWTWTCGNFFFFFGDGYLGHVGIFYDYFRHVRKEILDCAWLWEKFCLWWNFGGALIFFVGQCFLVVGHFWTCDFWNRIFGHGIFGME